MIIVLTDMSVVYVYLVSLSCYRKINIFLIDEKCVAEKNYTNGIHVKFQTQLIMSLNYNHTLNEGERKTATNLV